MMHIGTYIPSPCLQPYIRAYKIIESQDDMVNRVLPEVCPAVAFRFKGQVSYVTDNLSNKLPAAVISGLRTSVRLINYLKDTATLIVLFKEAGAAAFFQVPLHELFEESVSLDNFVRRQEIDFIEEQLSEVSTDKQRITIIERFLLSILREQQQDTLITAAVKEIQLSKGMVSIRTLADQLYISQDAFEKRFRKTIGTSPKKFSSIIRLKSIIQTPPTSFTDMALEAGYFDQPHFNKDFKRFTGLTPTAFFKTPSFW